VPVLHAEHHHAAPVWAGHPGLTLEDLSLSYNFIPGQIPDQLQQRPFKSLDLSNNRLTGTLRTSFGAYSEGRMTMNASSLSLTNNRLSWLIPSTIKRYGSVSMLLGNSFNCRIDKRDLPQKGSDAGIYDCGSNTVEFRRAITTLTTHIGGIEPGTSTLRTLTYQN